MYSRGNDDACASAWQVLAVFDTGWLFVDPGRVPPGAVVVFAQSHALLDLRSGCHAIAVAWFGKRAKRGHHDFHAVVVLAWLL